LEELNNSLNSLNKGLEKQLIQVQKTKENLLKLLSSDLQVQQANLFNKEQNNSKLHQELVAQIEIKFKEKKVNCYTG
jgi:hypothetical protein